MRILALTRSAINSDDNMGNTIENLFGNSSQTELHNLYMRSGAYTNSVCKSVYQIPEQQLIRSVISRKKCGAVVQAAKVEDKEESSERKAYDFAKRVNFYSLWFMREIIWTVGNWKTEGLAEYIQSVNPEILFMPSFGCWYPYKVLRYIRKYSDAKVVLYHADDNYSLKQLCVSPLYWLYRLNLRNWIRDCVRHSDLNFCISKPQVREYEKAFDIKCELLQKTGDFALEPQREIDTKKPIRLVYTGNISSGRWKTLASIGSALRNINKNRTVAQLFVYSGTKITPRMNMKLKPDNSLVYMGYVNAQEVRNIQDDADVLVHVESFALKNRLEVRLSFSTKIVDYLTKKKCILAVGPASVASIQYFMDNDAGYVISEINEIEGKLKNLFSNKNLISIYADKAWKSGKQNHSSSIDETELYKRLLSLL